MKSILLVFVTLVSFQSHARSVDVSGNITLDDGTSILRIDVNKDRELRGRRVKPIDQRVRSLEIAVSQLQERVYQLEAEPASRAMFICGYATHVYDFEGQGPTDREAARNAIFKCKQQLGYDSIFCKLKDIDLEDDCFKVR